MMVPRFYPLGSDPSGSESGAVWGLVKTGWAWDYNIGSPQENPMTEVETKSETKERKLTHSADCGSFFPPE